MAGPIPNANASVPMPTVPPSAKPITVTSDLDRGARRPRSGRRSAAGSDQHQRVARAGARARPRCRGPSRSPITRTPPTMRTMRGRRAARSDRAVDCVARASSRSTKTPIRTAFATVPGPIAAPSAQATTSTTRATTMLAIPKRQRRVLGDALVEHVPRGQPEPRLEQNHDAERRRGRARRRARRPARPGRERGRCPQWLPLLRGDSAGGVVGPTVELPAPAGGLFRRRTTGTARTAANQT